MNQDKVTEFAKKFDWNGLAKAYRESEISWSEKEWKELFEKIKAQQRSEIREKIDKLQIGWYDAGEGIENEYTAQEMKDKILALLTSK